MLSIDSAKEEMINSGIVCTLHSIHGNINGGLRRSIMLRTFLFTPALSSC